MGLDAAGVSATAIAAALSKQAATPMLMLKKHLHVWKWVGCRPGWSSAAPDSVRRRAHTVAIPADGLASLSSAARSGPDPCGKHPAAAAARTDPESWPFVEAARAAKNHLPAGVW